MSTALALVPAAASLAAVATNEIEEEIPELVPPRGEIPPAFWEQNGLWVVLASVLVLVLAAAAIWYFTRPKPQVVVPAEEKARESLKPLEKRPEDGALLSHVSQVVRGYVTAAYDLPPGERTTTEFNQAIAEHEALGPELPLAIGDFLRRCDERKFAPSVPPSPIGAVDQALQIIDRSEARLADLREQAHKTANPAQS